ncbi:MAG: hypothetical protein P8L44_12605 [Opitutales bacterium]|nr:hypothetical protein [Opitutales bacterium]MDG2168752.1 hypothetical protein [Opitutales bacterium]
MRFQFLSYLFAVILTTSVSAQSTKSSDSAEDPTNLTPYQRVSMYLGHSLFKANPIERQSEMLWGIKTVKPLLEISAEVEGDFEVEKLKQKMLSVLGERAVHIDNENGHLLLLRIRGVWDKNNTTLLYTYDLDLVDRVYVSRDGQIKSNYRSVWNVSNMGFAGKDVFENAMLINIESAIERFAISFYEQLDFDIISDTPRLAKQTYQKKRDGQEDILKLPAMQELAE